MVFYILEKNNHLYIFTYSSLSPTTHHPPLTPYLLPLIMTIDDKKYSIGEYHFKNKKLAYTFVKDKIYSFGYGVYKPNTVEYAFLSNLSRTKPKAFILEQNPANKTAIHMAIIHNYGRRETSWTKYAQFKFLANPQKNLNQALRNAINHQLPRITEYDFCQNCGTTNQLSVDHIIPFKTLTTDFKKIMKEEKIKIPIHFDRNYTYSKIFKEGDSLFCQKWKDYHLKKATYQILCVKCNSSKGVKTHAKPPNMERRFY